MPIIKSAKKRVRTANKATIRNRKTKRSMKESIKALQASLQGDKKKALELQSRAQSAIDAAYKKGVIHKNKAARKKAQLSKAVKEAGLKPIKKSAKVTSKPAAKKTGLKKSPTKKSATKKSTPKKTVAKKII